MLPTKSIAAAAFDVQIAQAIMFRIAQLGQSSNHQTSSHEISIPGLIQTTLTNVVTPLMSTIDELNARTTVCKCKKRTLNKMTTLKKDITKLKTQVEHIKSITKFNLITGHKLDRNENKDIREEATNTDGEEPMET